MFFERSVEKKNQQCAVIYTRISKDKQVKGLSLESQFENCEKYCNNCNFEILHNYSEIVSARDMSKQKKLLNIAENYSYTNIIINDVSRFSRNVKDGVNFIDKLKRKNIVLHFVEKDLQSNNNIDYKTILSDLKDAEIEIDTLSRRMKRTIKFKKENKLYTPSTPKYGSKHTKILNDNRITIKVEINKVEQKIIQLINKMYYGSISKEIEDLLIELTGDKEHRIYDYEKNCEVSEVRRGNMTKKGIAEFLNYINIFKRGRKWTSGMVSNILKNSNYLISKISKDQKNVVNL